MEILPFLNEVMKVEFSRVLRLRKIFVRFEKISRKYYFLLAQITPLYIHNLWDHILQLQCNFRSIWLWSWEHFSQDPL